MKKSTFFSPSVFPVHIMQAVPFSKMDLSRSTSGSTGSHKSITSSGMHS